MIKIKNKLPINYLVPYLKFNFYDNPYMIGIKSKYDDYYYNCDKIEENVLDKYKLEIPLHLHVSTNNSTNIYSLLDKQKFQYCDNLFLKNNLNEFFPSIEKLLKKYTINNENIKLNLDSVELVDKEAIVIEKNKFPIFIYPEQIISKQYKVNKSPYDIKTILRFNNDNVSEIWKKV